MWKRPINDEGWKLLFPDGLDGKKLLTEAKVKKAYKVPKIERPESNPLWKMGMNDVNIFTSVQNLFPTLAQSRPKLNLDRRHNNSSIQALVVTSVTYNIDSSNRHRDWTPICAWSIAEFAFVKMYRQKLLEGPAGAIRISFNNIFDTFCCSEAQATSGFSWCDHLTVKDADEILIATGEIDIKMAVARLSEQDEIQLMKSEIQRLTSTWENSPLCTNLMGDGQNVDKKISDAITKLISVCGYFISLCNIHRYFR